MSYQKFVTSPVSRPLQHHNKYTECLKNKEQIHFSYNWKLDLTITFKEHKWVMDALKFFPDLEHI